MPSERRGRLRSVVTPRTALVLTVVVLAGWFVFLRPQPLGGPAAYVIVSGTSMEPTLHEGDLVVMTRAEQYLPGDVVAYRVPEPDPAAGRHVIHRVLGGSGDAGYRLQGDNTDAPDRWFPTDADMVGRQMFVLPGAGKALTLLQSPAIVAGLAAALVVFWLPLWEPRAGDHSPRAVPASSTRPARIRKLHETVMATGGAADEPGGAQVLVEFRNDGDGWAEVLAEQCRFTANSADGSVVARGTFGAVSSALVAPGGIGYLLADIPEHLVRRREPVAVHSILAYRDARQWASKLDYRGVNLASAR